MDTLGELARFFSFSPKRQNLLGDKVREFCPRSKREKLLDICVMRWIDCIDAIEGFLDLAEPILDTLETIANNHSGNWNSDSKLKTNGLYHTIATFQFIFAATLLGEALSLLRGLTTKLQSKGIDIMTAYQDVQIVAGAVKEMRKNVEDTHKQIYSKAVDRATNFSLSVGTPRICGRQKNRANAPAATSEAYYKNNVTIPFLDHLSQELESRFGDDQQGVVQGWAAMPEMMKKLPDWKTSFRLFCKIYEEVLPNYQTLEAELRLWDEKWNQTVPRGEPLPATVAATLSECDPIMYSNI